MTDYKPSIFYFDRDSNRTIGFSVRRSALFVSLFCCYIEIALPWKRYGIGDAEIAAQLKEDKFVEWGKYDFENMFEILAPQTIIRKDGKTTTKVARIHAERSKSRLLWLPLKCLDKWNYHMSFKFDYEEGVPFGPNDCHYSTGHSYLDGETVASVSERMRKENTQTWNYLLDMGFKE